MKSSKAKDITRDTLAPPTASSSSGPTNANDQAGGSLRDGGNKPSPAAVLKGVKWKGKSGRTQILSDCIMLKNLDYKVTYDSLAKVIRHVMPDDRQFVELELVEDRIKGSFRGLAFVTFANDEDATLAIEELAKVVINGRPVFAEFRRVRATDRDNKYAKKLDAANSRSSSNQSHGSLPFESSISASSTGANSSGKGVKMLDKRPQFFANRANDRRFEANLSERERERESEFRELLTNFAKGWTDETRADSNNSGDQGVENEPPKESPNSVAVNHARDTEGSEEGGANGGEASGTSGAEDTSTTDDMVFDATLTSYERRMVHIICDELKLGHISRFDEEGSRVLHVTRDRQRAAEWAREEAENQSRSTGGIEFGRRKNEKAEGGRGGDAEIERPKLNYYCPRQMAADGGGYAHGGGGIRAPTYRLYTPTRQPSGPDGSVGFNVRRKHHGLALATVAKEKEGVVKTAKESKGKGKSRKMDANTFDEDGENGKDSKVQKGKGKGKGGGKGRKTSNSSLNPFVPAFSPNGGS